MKVPSLIYKAVCISFFVMLAFACNDNLEKIGFSIQPDGEGLAMNVDTLTLSAETVQVDSIFSRTKYPVLGEYVDPVFGSIKSDYMGEFYLPEGIGFHDDVRAIDSVRLLVSYTSIIGDSLSPMQVLVYGLNKQLPNNNYTNVSPDEYYQSPELGSATFTGKNAVYRKEAYYTSAYTVDTMLIYEIGVKLPLELGEKFLTEYKKTGHGSFSDADSFRKFFPGVYVTTGFGSSTILNVSLSSLYVHYKYNDPKGSSQKTDTIRSTALQLNITPEVAQVNTVENNNEQLLAPGSAHSYIKSPAGVYTKLKFPFSDIHSRLGEGQSINLAALTLYADPEVYEDAAVKLSPPSYLLLIHKDSLQGFFEEGKMPDNRTGFLSAAFNATTYSYSFNNISALVNYYNEQNNYKAFDLEYYLIPVDVTTQTNSRTGQVEVTSVSNQMMPTAVRLDKQPENMKLEMIFSKF